VSTKYELRGRFKDFADRKLLIMVDVKVSVCLIEWMLNTRDVSVADHGVYI
jgi:hypothetical protein